MICFFIDCLFEYLSNYQKSIKNLKHNGDKRIGYARMFPLDGNLDNGYNLYDSLFTSKIHI